MSDVMRRLCVFLMLALVATFGCAGQGPSDELRVELDRIERQIEALQRSQQELRDRLDGLDRLAVQMAAPQRRPGSPDPDKKYIVTVGNAPTKGPKGAAVTIVGWFDFQ